MTSAERCVGTYSVVALSNVKKASRPCLARCYLVLLYFSQKAKFGLPGDRFFNEIAVFALKKPPKKFACGGLVNPGFFILQKFSPAASFYYFSFFKIFLLLLFSQNPGKIFSCSYYFIFKGGFISISPVW